MKKIEAEMGQFYRVWIENDDCSMYGDYNFDLFGQGETPEQAILNALDNTYYEMILKLVIVDVRWSLGEAIKYEGKNYVYFPHDIRDLEILRIAQTKEIIKNSTSYRKALEARETRKNQEQEEREARERVEWERLNEKFKKEG